VIKAREDDPEALLAYVTKIAFEPTSEALSALVKVSRLDLSIEYLVADESKVYAPLFGDDARERPPGPSSAAGRCKSTSAPMSEPRPSRWRTGESST
jgi:hypothetical protein